MKFDIKCKNCSRYLASTTKSMSAELKCSNSKCKSLETYNITFMSDMILNGHKHESKDNTHEKKIAELEEKLAELDGRTKEAKELKAQLEEANEYIEKLEAL